MKIHSKQFGDGVVQIETGTTLPRGTPFTDGRLFFLNKQYDTNFVGLYTYDATKAKWFLVNETRNLQITNMSTTEEIVYSLTNNTEERGSRFATVVLSEDNTHAKMSVKGSGEGEAEGFIFRNGDLGKDVLRADNDTFEYLESKVWHEKNLNPHKFQPRSRAIDVRVNHMARSHEILFVNTKGGEIIIKLPHLITVGDYLDIIDDDGTFGENPCIINGRGQKINGREEDVELNIPGQWRFVYQNGNKGWRCLQL